MSRFVDAYNEDRRSSFSEALPEDPNDSVKAAAEILKEKLQKTKFKLGEVIPGDQTGEIGKAHGERILKHFQDRKKINQDNLEELAKRASELRRSVERHQSQLEDAANKVRQAQETFSAAEHANKIAAGLLAVGGVALAGKLIYDNYQSSRLKQKTAKKVSYEEAREWVRKELKKQGVNPTEKQLDQVIEQIKKNGTGKVKINLSEGMNQQATALAVAAGLPIFAKGIAAAASKSNNTSGKRKEAYEMLKRMGLKNPTDQNVDDYLIHRAGRRTREEEAHDKLDMPDSKIQRAGNMAAAGSIAGAALGLAAGVGAAQRKMGNGNIFTSIPAGALTPVRNIPTATAVGSMVGGVAGAYFGTRLWNAQKAEKDAQRPPSKRESESKFVAAYNESKERAAEALNPVNVLGRAKAAKKVSEFAKDVVSNSGAIARGVGKDVKNHAPEIAGGLTGLAVVDAAAKSKKKPREEKETMHNGGDLNKNAKGMNSGKRDGDGDGKLNESFSGNGEDFGYLQDLLSESLKDSAKDAASKGLNFAKQGANVVGNKINQVAGPGATPKAMAGMGMIGAAALAHRAFKSLRAKGNMDPSDDDLHNEMRQHDERYNNGGELNKNPVGMKNKPQAPAGKVWRFGKLVDETDAE